METARLKAGIDQSIAAGETSDAIRGLRELWRSEPGLATASFVNPRYEELKGEDLMFPFRLAILRSFTVEPLMPLLRAAAFDAGIEIKLHLGEFNAYAQEILDPDGPLYRFNPDAVLVAVQTRDIAPDLWSEDAPLEESAGSAIVARVTGQLRDLIGVFREHSRAHLIVHTLEQPEAPAATNFGGLADSQSNAISRINEELRSLASAQIGIYLLDYDALIARHGRASWHDERKWLAARFPIAANHMIHMTTEWMRFLHPLTGKVAKAVAVDLDNTLWGGIVGEDGMSGIRVAAESFQAVQRALLDLHARGIILCVSSKNNPEDALEVLNNHPDMLLRSSHFAAKRFNWNDKTESLRELAAELGIGIDAMAFLDDNPAERELVRTALPEVMVVDLPDDPSGFATALLDCPWFERLSLVEEDKARSSYYAAERERAEHQRQSLTREDFFHSLKQEAEVAAISARTLGRGAQLTQKTNQFNLTTRRYTEQQLADLSAKPGWHILTLRARDRFGDNGLVGLAIMHDRGQTWEIDTFLLSCRVIGRTLETALLSGLVTQARKHGAKQLRGYFFPTKKNAPARDFYAAHGFEQSPEPETGSCWTLDLAAQNVRCPEWVRLTIVNGDQV